MSNMPLTCSHCEHGHTYDLSVDDLVTYCRLTKRSQDWCDFPDREDETIRMSGCPLKEVEVAT